MQPQEQLQEQLQLQLLLEELLPLEPLLRVILEPIPNHPRQQPQLVHLLQLRQCYLQELALR